MMKPYLLSLAVGLLVGVIYALFQVRSPAPPVIALVGLLGILIGEQLPPLPKGTTATVLPAFGVTGADVDAVKFTQVLRGYKTSEVDWVLDRLGRELEALRGQLAALQASSVPES